MSAQADGRLPLYLAEGLEVVFCGFNPGIASGLSGHYYAHPSNHFWQLLAEAGLTSVRLRPEQDHEMPALGYGFTDLVRRMSRSSKELRKEELRDGAARVRAELTRYRPRICAFTGKGVARAVTGRPVTTGWLLQAVVPGVRGMVLSSPSGLAAMAASQRLAPYLELASAVRGTWPR